MRRPSLVKRLRERGEDEAAARIEALEEALKKARNAQYNMDPDVWIDAEDAIEAVLEDKS